MSKLAKLSLAVLVSGVLVGVIGVQFPGCQTPETPENPEASATTQQSPATQKAPEASLPKLVDLGAKTCTPCKKMAPILEELATDYTGVFDVEFIDVSIQDNVKRAEAYKIKLIPTQIFLDATGTELWRHEGFMDKAAILAKWKELGYEI